jgi:hypothetical protein
MKAHQQTRSLKTIKLLAACGLGLACQPLLKADVVILESGGVLAGKVLQQDDDGILIQLESGTHRYPKSWVKEVKKEPVAAPHVSNNGQRIPDWAQIVTLLADAGWSQGLKQVPATMLEAGIWKNVPYISFQCRSGGYELNIFGDLSKPAAVQIGAMTYLKSSDEARSNCVNLICSVLANADDRKMVRALNWNPKDTEKNGGMIFETILPGEWGSYGGWWVSVYSEDALAAARASDAELLMLTQPPVAAPQPVAVVVQPAATDTAVAAQPADTTPPPATTTTQTPPTTTTTYTTYAVPAWSAEELAYAHPAAAGANPAVTAAKTPGVTAAKTPASPAAKVYPRTYTRTGGSYGHAATPRR